jgi:hypothetical protein
VFENSLKREISNETAAMIAELARRFALEFSFQIRPKKQDQNWGVPFSIYTPHKLKYSVCQCSVKPPDFLNFPCNPPCDFNTILLS